jgi:hypothetical protein
MEKNKTGFLQGLALGLLPHTVCIAFVVLTIVGATAATAIFRQLLLLPNFFEMLIGLSLILATFSAVFYLQRLGIMSLRGLKRKWRYLTILYGTTVGINLLFFLVVFPAIANLNFAKTPTVLAGQTNLSELTLQVQVPCSGHAPLIIGELRKLSGVSRTTFESPNYFKVSYDPSQVSPDQILDLEVFKTFPAKIVQR